MSALTLTAAILTGIAASIAGDRAIKRWPWFALWWYAAWAIISTALAALDLVLHRWNWAAFMTAVASINAWYWWQRWNRRKRKNASALSGAKSRARLQAVVAKHRAAGRGLRPVLKESP
jgi:membrane protein implicated in regulation of membrane protease activity